MKLFRYAAGVFALWCVFAITNPAAAATWYVRADGGTAAQCTGATDAPYPGSGSGQACAFSHPFFALQPGAKTSTFTPTTVMQPGDTLVIGSGSYMMGYGVPNIPSSNGCDNPGTWSCTTASIPSGIDAQHPTVITGANCAAPPELWGTHRVSSIFNVDNTHDVTLSCLELTDHSNCIEAYRPTTNTGGVTACERTTYPYGTWAVAGIHAARTTNLTMTGLNIHGFADYGVIAGALSGTTTVTDVTIRANGWGGWNGDLGGNNHTSSNAGALNFTRVNIEWNGCAENYPNNVVIVGCWGQVEGGYGDGLGEAWTGGNWTFTNSRFAHNAQDGLDLLYANGTGSIFLDQVISEFNAGNQIKTAGPATMQNSVINGYCNDWAGFPIAGDNATGVSGSMCRAVGTAVVMDFTASNQSVNVNFSTITGNGDTLFIAGAGSAAAPGWQPDATDHVNLSNSVWRGQTSVIPRNQGRMTGLDWYSDLPYLEVVTYTNNIVWNVKNNRCPVSSICTSPMLVSETLAAFNPTPVSNSPAIGAAVQIQPMPLHDYLGNPRPTGLGNDIGAIQYGNYPAPWVYFDTIFVGGFAAP